MIIIITKNKALLCRRREGGRCRWWITPLRMKKKRSICTELKKIRARSKSNLLLLRSLLLLRRRRCRLLRFYLPIAEISNLLFLPLHCFFVLLRGFDPFYSPVQKQPKLVSGGVIYFGILGHRNYAKFQGSYFSAGHIS